MTGPTGPTGPTGRVGPAGRHGWWPRTSLRNRLTAGVVLLLMLTCAAIGVLTAMSLRAFQIGRLDEQLASAGGRFATSLEHGVAPGGADGDADNRIPGQAEGTLGIRLVSGKVLQAAVVERDGSNEKPVFDAADLAVLAALPVPSGPLTVQLSTLDDYRVQTVAGQDGDVQLTGLPLVPVEDTVAKLVRVEIAVFAGIVLVGGALAAVIVRLTLRPLTRVTEAAAQVSDLPLAGGTVEFPGRLPSVPPGTEIGRLTSAFDHMLAHVELSLAARAQTEARLRQFVADASHELRTPLSVMRSQVELVLLEPDLPAEAHRALGRVDAHARRMGFLVDDLLTLARLDAGLPQTRHRVDLSRLAIDTVADASATGRDHRWQLDLDEEPVEALADDRAVHQILANLLTNAQRHTPAGTSVTVRVRCQDGSPLITVTDDGPGIPHTLQASLFERFTRADPARAGATRFTGQSDPGRPAGAAAGGSGLGLAIVDGLVRANGGVIEVASRPGRTEFAVRFVPIGPDDRPADRAGTMI